MFELAKECEENWEASDTNRLFNFINDQNPNSIYELTEKSHAIGGVLCYNVRHLHFSLLFLVLHLGPLVLLLLQLLGHQQVLLHQFALINVGRQVALDCRRKHKQKRRLNKCTYEPVGGWTESVGDKKNKKNIKQ